MRDGLVFSEPQNLARKARSWMFATQSQDKHNWLPRCGKQCASDDLVASTLGLCALASWRFQFFHSGLHRLKSVRNDFSR